MAVVKVKSTVRPRALFIMAACVNVVEEMGVRELFVSGELLVTSANDSKHMKGSRHYSGDALDVRSKTMRSLVLKQEFLARVLSRLGESYQGILECQGGPNEHFHFEHDPQ